MSDITLITITDQETTHQEQSPNLAQELQIPDNFFEDGKDDNHIPFSQPNDSQAQASTIDNISQENTDTQQFRTVGKKVRV